MVKAAWFKNYAPNELPDKFDQIVQSWDTANKASELSDFSVCTTWGVKGKNLYLLHVMRRRMEYPELKCAVREQCEAFAANVVLIEDKASGTELIQELVAEGVHAVTRYQPQSDKIMRMHAQTAMIENGFVHLLKEAVSPSSGGGDEAAEALEPHGQGVSSASKTAAQCRLSASSRTVGASG